MLTRSGRRRTPMIGNLAVTVAALVLVVGAVTTGAAATVVLAALAAPLGVALYRRPQRGLLLLAALLPYDGLLNVVPHPPLLQAWKEVLLLGTLALALIHRDRRPFRGPTALPLPRWATALAGLAVVAVGSAIAVGGPRALYGLKVYFFWTLIIVIVRLTPFTARDRDQLVTILMLGGWITTAIAFAQQAAGAERLVALGWSYNTDVRYTGGFLRSFSTFDGGPFPYAYFVALVLVLGLAVALSDTSRTRNRLFLLSTPFLVLGLGSAFVRGAWVLAILGLLVVGTIRRRVLLLLLPLGLVLLAVLPPYVAAAALAGSSTVERSVGWQETLAAASRQPLGAGIATTSGGGLRAAEFGGEEVAVFEPDSQYVLVLYELGPPGLLCFLILLAGLLFAAREAARRHSGSDADLALGVTGVIAGMLGAAFFASILQIFPFDAYLWLLVAAVHSMDAPRSSRSDQVDRAAIAFP